MSLINDALKKARQAQQQKPPAVGTEHFRPVESGRQRSNLVFLLPVAIVFLSAAGGVLVWLALQRSGVIHRETVLAKSKPSTEQTSGPGHTEITTTAAQPFAQKNAAVPVSPRKASVQNSSVAQSKPPEGGTPNKGQPGAAPQAETSQVQNAITVAPTKPVLPKLLGISYSPSRPSAVLNRKSVFVGDSVDGFRVLAITLHSVTVVNAGQTNVLTWAE